MSVEKELVRVKGAESRSPGESVAGSVVGVRLGHENGLNWKLGCWN